MNEDDLLKGGRVAALPNSMEARLVSHATSRKRDRYSHFDLLAPGKITEEDRMAMIFGPLPLAICEEEEDDDYIELFTSELLKRELPVEVI